jgi:hypothetical protein
VPQKINSGVELRRDFKISVVTTSVEIPYRFLDVDRSFSACFPMMLLHHQIEEDIKEVREEDMDEEEDEDMVEVEEYHPLVLIVEKWSTFEDFVPNHALSMGILIVPSMPLNIFQIY